jgi:DNA primase
VDKPTCLADFVGPSRESGTQVNYKHCPVCGDTRWKVYVNPITGKWYCFAGMHSAGGCVDVGLPAEGAGRQLLDQLQNVPAQGANSWPEIELPPFCDLTPRARKYLHKRGFTDETIARHHLVEWDDPDRFRIIVPFFGAKGCLTYWTSRAYSPLDSGPKYVAASGRHPLYVLPRWEQAARRVVVEGVFDALAVYQGTGLDVVALCGKSLPKYLVPDLAQVVSGQVDVLLDGDAIGDAFKIRAALATKFAVRIIVLPINTDPADAGEQLKELLT